MKTHKLTIFLPCPLKTSLPQLKTMTLAALSSPVSRNEDPPLPTVQTEDDFELYTVKKSGEFELLTKWASSSYFETLFIGYRDADGIAALMQCK